MCLNPLLFLRFGVDSVNTPITVEVAVLFVQDRRRMMFLTLQTAINIVARDRRLQTGLTIRQIASINICQVVFGFCEYTLGAEVDVGCVEVDHLHIILKDIVQSLNLVMVHSSLYLPYPYNL